MGIEDHSEIPWRGTHSPEEAERRNREAQQARSMSTDLAHDKKVVSLDDVKDMNDAEKNAEDIIAKYGQQYANNDKIEIHRDQYRKYGLMENNGA